MPWKVKSKKPTWSSFSSELHQNGSRRRWRSVRDRSVPALLPLANCHEGAHVGSQCMKRACTYKADCLLTWSRAAQALSPPAERLGRPARAQRGTNTVLWLLASLEHSQILLLPPRLHYTNTWKHGRKVNPKFLWISKDFRKTFQLHGQRTSRRKYFRLRFSLASPLSQEFAKEPEQITSLVPTGWWWCRQLALLLPKVHLNCCSFSNITYKDWHF